MLKEENLAVKLEQEVIPSVFMNRQMVYDLYIPKNGNSTEGVNLLLINDGQNLEEMGFVTILSNFLKASNVSPVLCIGIYAGSDRKNEYGISGQTDFAGRGAKAGAYEHFILEELLPQIKAKFSSVKFHKTGFAGFSLGGLTALDLSWKHPQIFQIAGVFSGSLWWRSKALEDGYVEDRDRIMHQLIREGTYHSGQRFYFTTGSLDETADRNNNGIIDSIDDTLDLIKALKEHGYKEPDEIEYVNYKDGRHDIPTWGLAFPGFLQWAFGRREGKPHI